jgi:hypothetical protein
MRMKTLRWLGAIGVAFATQACVVREAPPVNAGYYPQARISSGGGVAIPQPYAVSTMPPDPLYEQMTASPGMGHVWIDGSWHWNGYEWVWVSGRWEQDQADHVYVQPYYDYSGDTYIYTPGYWSSRDRLPRGSIVRDHRDGRPSVVSPRPRPPRPPVAQPRDPYRPLPPRTVSVSREPRPRKLRADHDAAPFLRSRRWWHVPTGTGPQQRLSSSRAAAPRRTTVAIVRHRHRRRAERSAACRPRRSVAGDRFPRVATSRHHRCTTRPTAALRHSRDRHRTVRRSSRTLLRRAPLRSKARRRGRPRRPRRHLARPRRRRAPRHRRLAVAARVVRSAP